MFISFLELVGLEKLGFKFLALFEKAVEPLGGGTLLEEPSHQGRALGFCRRSHFVFTLCFWSVTGEQSDFCSVHSPFPACCHAVAVRVDHIR